MWTIRLVENESLQAMMLRDDEVEAFLDFTSLEGMLAWLSLQPRNRVRVENPEFLKELGAPYILYENGNINRTATIRHLLPSLKTASEIAKATGFPEQQILEVVSRLRQHKHEKQQHAGYQYVLRKNGRINKQATVRKLLTEGRTPDEIVSITKFRPAEVRDILSLSLRGL